MSAPDLSALRIDDHKRSSRGKPWLRWTLGIIFICALIVLSVFALRSRDVAVEVMTVHASTGDNNITLLNASGYVTPRRRSTIAAKITGLVTAVYAEEGMHVREGQVLATLDESDAKVRLDSAKADMVATRAGLADLKVNLANAQLDLARAKGLAVAGVGTQQALDLARTNVESYQARIMLTKEQVLAAESKVAVAQQDLDNCVVRAPYAGLVVSKDAQVGEMVSPISAGGGFTRTGIATLVDMNSLEIEVDVNESYIARVVPGQRVIAVLDAYPDWKIPAHVRTIIPTADRQKATVKVRISFDKLDPRIIPDMGVKVSFLEDQPRSASKAPKIMVPSAAVRNDNGSTIVFLYRDGKLERRAVKVGDVSENQEEIIAGLTDGDQIVSRDLANLRDGEAVRIKQ